MKIIVDQEWYQNISKMTDELLKAKWITSLLLANKIIGNIQIIPETIPEEKQEKIVAKEFPKKGKIQK